MNPLINMAETGNLSSKFEYVNLLCDSASATGPADSTNTILNHPNFEFTNETFRPAGIKVMSAIIPFTYYVINTTNNTILLNSLPVDVPPGTYTGQQLAATLKTIFEDATSATWTIGFNSQTLKFTFEWSSTFWNIQFGFGINQNDSMKDILGFNDTVYNSPVLAPYVLTSDKIANPTGPTYLCVNSSSIGQTVRAIANNTAGGRPVAINQIAKIPIDVQPGGVIFFNDPNPQNFYDFKEGTKFNSFDLYLTLGTEENTILDLNGQSFSVTICLLQYRQGGSNVLTRPTSNTFISP